MLKALELSGFKSFADKTRFEFPAGITVVVGPNGSGKSNIVDAIKWVLGEQSAKSLRGKEMADVIFKGAGGPNGRKPSNSATATIVIDNTDRRFSYDSDEVHVSRRVYRSGEAEYLINNEICRLKDIRNMFRGTGIGTDAYSLIEQGKVDRLLQASAKDRRAIFEEAAGISRFKAKKTEAQRRLARVEGNLIRLSDIVEEVGSRYRSIKNQAAKAAKYKEYTDRLQELRTYVGFKDWRAINEKLEQIDAGNEAAIKQLAAFKKTIAESETQSDQIELRLESFSQQVISHQQSSLKLREEITQHKSQISLHESRIADLDARRKELESQSQRLASRQEEIVRRDKRLDADVVASTEQLSDSKNQVRQLDTELSEIDARIAGLISENEKARDDCGNLISLINELGRLVSAADSQIESYQAKKRQTEQFTVELSTNLAQRNQQLATFSSQREALETDAESKNSALSDARKKHDATTAQIKQLQKELTATGNSLTGKSQRRNVLVELEKKLEGVNAGAKQLLEQSKKATSGPLTEIIGVVADMLSVNVQHAGIVDVALGNAAQYIVVDGSELIRLLASDRLKVKGRVGIIQLEDPPTLGADPNVSINGEPGVIGRADRLVQVNSKYANFVRRLLGGTWIVKTLADAIAIYQRNLGRIRMVTLDGEIVEADGSVIVGPKAVVTGLVSRRSELRLLTKEVDELTLQQSDLELQLADLAQKEIHSAAQIQQLINENTSLAQQLADIKIRSEEIEKQVVEFSQKLAAAEQDAIETDSLLTSTAAELSSNRQNLSLNENRLEELNQVSIATDSTITQLRADRSAREQHLTDGKVALAKSQQQLDSLQQQRSQFDSEKQQLLEELARNEEQLKTDSATKEAASVEIGKLQSRLENLENDLQSRDGELKEVVAEKDKADKQRREVSKVLLDSREQLRRLEDQLHKTELKTSHLQMERTKLVERLQEDYGIDVAELDVASENPQEAEQRDAIDDEISALRKKIGSIGAVNMDALAELEDLEKRYTKMDEQYQDLVSAKQSLENIIQRINTDSRRLFVETLEAIRGNFQTLYRQTFGGGKADIILEEGVDPLEAGVEIIATPPGKPEFNNSLLSGGEKALTAVSLLMAIFQFRPSPFCVLDEVDAPFDEANIGRFIDVLKSFLGWTKFVIVTHSKKTMTAATTLYGVTMQESGVSKRVSVRFEDVGEDGQISDDAVKREDNRGVA